MNGDGRGACIEWLLARRVGPTGCDHEAPDEWLLSRGIAAVSVADPQHFEIPGPFLAHYAGGWAVMFGVTAGVVHDPLGVATGPVLEAQVLASLELEGSRWLARGGRAAGVVTALAVAADAGAPMRSLGSARVIAGAGLEGDRYARGEGTFSARGGRGRELTLVEAEAIEELRATAGIALDALDARRNVVVRGIDLDALIGKRFRLGAVECAGRRRCEPCARLEQLTEPGVLRGLVHRGGLRADVLAGGEIRVGDEIEALPR